MEISNDWSDSSRGDCAKGKTFEGSSTSIFSGLVSLGVLGRDELDPGTIMFTSLLDRLG